MTSTSLQMRCPVCNGQSFQAGPQIFDDRYGQAHIFNLASCKNCRHLATAPRLSESDLPALYGTYYPRKAINAAQVAQEAAKILKPQAALRRWWNGTDNQGQYSVRAGQSMLDVGCGSGCSLLEAQALGAKAFGIEADPNVRPIAQALGLSIHFGSLQDEPFPGQRFDLIVMNQVIEHLPDPDQALRQLAQRLAPEGRLFLVMPNTESIWKRLSGTRWINWHIPYHQHHFNQRNFIRMAQACGLKMVRKRTITPNVWTVLQVRSMFSKPQLGMPSPIWAVSPPAAQDSAMNSGANPVKVIVRGVILTGIALVNRITDALGQGDSLLVELQSERVS